MGRLLKIENDEDFKWLASFIVNWNIKCQNNISAYVEYAEMFERLHYAIESSERIVDPNAPEPEKKPRAPRGSKKDLDPRYCPTHPKYGAKRVPRTECDGCWAAYAKFNPLSPNLRRRKA